MIGCRPTQAAALCRENPTIFACPSMERFPMKAMTFFGLAVFVLSIGTRLTAAAELKVGDAAPDL